MDSLSVAKMNPPSSDAVFWFIQDITYKIVAETGIPSDRYHLGKILLRSLKDGAHQILQIDGGTDEKDTFKSALERSIRCATAFRNLGLKYQDVIAIMAPNHINLVIPMYAALFLGIKVAGVDMTLRANELQDAFKCYGPRIIFCQSSKIHTVQQALDLSHLSAQIITFDEKEDFLSFSKFLDMYGGATTLENFKPSEFDPEGTHAFLVTTSGSSGLPKTAILSHKNVIVGFPFVMTAHTKFPTPVKLSLVVSPIQWLSSTFVFIMGVILRFTRLQTSSPTTPEHIYSLINKHRPDFTNMSPTFLRTLIKPGDREKCDFSSLQYLILGGSVVAKELIEEMQVSPVEIEGVIIKHPGVLDVVVTGILDAETGGDLPVALVILRDGHNVSAQEIKDLVKESLSDSKQLRGGVIFVKEFPTTSTSKVDRMKLKEWAKTLKKE